MLHRAEAYHEAGADALLIHSKKTTPDQIFAFAAAWDRPCPLVIVPTMYYSTPVEQFEQAGIQLVIWANHNVRSAIAAMQQTSRRIFEEQSVRNVEDQIATVREVFRLQNAEELAKAEERYLPKAAEPTRAIILAASRGSELGDLTETKPKAMLEIGGVPLLHKLVRQFRQARIKDVVVVQGYAKEEVHAPQVEFVDNEEHLDTGELLSLSKALPYLEGEIVLSFGDILFRKYILNNLLAEEGDLVIAVDAAWQRRQPVAGYVDYVGASRPYSLLYDESPVYLQDMAPDLPADRIAGEWIGLLKATAAGTDRMKAVLRELQQEPDFRRLRLDRLFRELLVRGESIRVLYITGHWLDVDNLEDLAKAQAF
jgi:phosphoenolpyruvate phosphomutase